MIDGFERVLVLGAHPDDEMGCSGLLFELVERGAKVEVVIFSQCQDLNGPELLDEHREALIMLGISTEPTLYDFANRLLPAYRSEILSALDDRRGEFDLVLCPTTFDAHQDHATVAAEAKRAFKDATVLGYELPLNSFNGTLSAYAQLSSGAMDAKQMHVAAYRSQRTKSYMNPTYVEGLARVRGVQCGARWAEAFEVIRWVL
jgi:LmbE family N-acetylglucosaminyl deacetylase